MIESVREGGAHLVLEAGIVEEGVLAEGCLVGQEVEGGGWVFEGGWGFFFGEEGVQVFFVG